jgi:hypothetical protein
MTFIGFYFLFYILQFISIFYNSSLKQDQTNKNSIKIIIWLVVGGSSDNFHISLSL